MVIPTIQYIVVILLYSVYGIVLAYYIVQLGFESFSKHLKNWFLYSHTSLARQLQTSKWLSLPSNNSPFSHSEMTLNCRPCIYVRKSQTPGGILIGVELILRSITNTRGPIKKKAKA